MKVTIFNQDANGFQAEFANGVTLESTKGELYTAFVERVQATCKADYKEDAEVTAYDAKALKRLATAKLEELALTASGTGEKMIADILKVRQAAKSGAAVPTAKETPAKSAEKTTAKAKPDEKATAKAKPKETAEKPVKAAKTPQAEAETGKADEGDDLVGDLTSLNKEVLAELGAAPEKPAPAKAYTPDEAAKLGAKAKDAKDKATKELADLKKKMDEAKAKAKEAAKLEKEAKAANAAFKQRRRRNMPKRSLEEVQKEADQLCQNIGSWYAFPKFGTGEASAGELVGVSVDCRIPMAIMRFRLPDGTRCDKRPTPDVVHDAELTKTMQAAAAAEKEKLEARYPKTPYGDALRKAETLDNQISRYEVRLKDMKAEAKAAWKTVQELKPADA